MYTINSTQITSPLPFLNGNGIPPSLHPHAPCGLAEQESQFDTPFHRRCQRQSKKFHENRKITEDARWVRTLCKAKDIQCAEGVAKTFTEICYHLEKQIRRGYDNVTLDCAFLIEKLGRCRSSVSVYILGIEQAGLFSIVWYKKGKQRHPTRINFKITPLLLEKITDQEKNGQP